MSREFIQYLKNNLLTNYSKVMILQIYIKGINITENIGNIGNEENEENNDLKYRYINAIDIHNNKLYNKLIHIDAGFDLFTPSQNNNDDKIKFTKNLNKIDFKIKCSAKMYTDKGKIYNTGYYIYPRSSLSKTKLRLANSVGIIDSGYRGNIIGMFDLINQEEYTINQYDKLLQICAPSLVPIIIEIVNTEQELGETERGSNGFGSTGI